ncbi:damage-inducible protein DinB [Paenibacillus sp. SYP-B3998]|uniref:Damage-inducible protein DinB n=1 Tax=Paenibacillus sp. SYP-B3998 TaxID=2678564 RepID=A0A6G3ZYX0_9BACL|nr:DinB family protein [Paenibacillus sp. SYP-B3998]NEW07248.1 damage-inducible protein DinB [Paenibacillus sp. SYP-B3998]
MESQLIKNYEYHVWANTRVFQHLSKLPQGVLLQEISNVFPTIYEGLVHIFRVDTVWLAAMNNFTYEQTKTLLGEINEKTTGKNLEQLEAEYLNLAEQYRNFLSSDADMKIVKEYPHPMHGVLRASTEELVQHVVNHGTYHRGNLTSMLRQLGHAGEPSDYVLYLYEING